MINTSSIAGKEAHLGLGAYSATKQGVVGFTAAMNRELSADGIESGVLCPGLVDTELAAYPGLERAQANTDPAAFEAATALCR